MKGSTRIGQMAAHPRWCGGLRVEHAASLLGFRPDDERLMRAVWQARRLGLIDIWRGWVIADRAALDRARR